MAKCGFADQAFEEEHIIGQAHGVAMGEVQLNLPCAAFLQDAVNLKTLRFGKVIDVVNHLTVFIHGRQRIGLLARRTAARATHRRDDRLIGVDVARGEEEFHFRRHDRLPALGGVKVHDPAQHVARGIGHHIALLVLGVVDDLQGHICRPWCGGGGGPIRLEDHVGFGKGVKRVVGPFAGDGLQENGIRQEIVGLLGKLGGRHRLAPRHTGNIADHAFHLIHTTVADVFAGCFGQLVGPFGHVSHFVCSG